MLVLFRAALIVQPLLKFRFTIPGTQISVAFFLSNYLVPFCSWLSPYRLLLLQFHLGTCSTHEVWTRYRYVVVVHTQLAGRCLSRKLYVYFEVTVRGKSGSPEWNISGSRYAMHQIRSTLFWHRLGKITQNSFDPWFFILLIITTFISISVGGRQASNE